VKRKRYLYMIVTQDEFDLPIAVSESPSEIARIAGTTSNNVMSIACNAEKGIIKRSKYRRVLKDDKPM